MASDARARVLRTVISQLEGRDTEGAGSPARFYSPGTRRRLSGDGNAGAAAKRKKVRARDRLDAAALSSPYATQQTKIDPGYASPKVSAVGSGKKSSVGSSSGKKKSKKAVALKAAAGTMVSAEQKTKKKKKKLVKKKLMKKKKIAANKATMKKGKNTGRTPQASISTTLTADNLIAGATDTPGRRKAKRKSFEKCGPIHSSEGKRGTKGSGKGKKNTVGERHEEQGNVTEGGSPTSLDIKLSRAVHEQNYEQRQLTTDFVLSRIMETIAIQVVGEDAAKLLVSDGTVDTAREKVEYIEEEDRPFGSLDTTDSASPGQGEQPWSEEDEEDRVGFEEEGSDLDDDAGNVSGRLENSNSNPNQDAPLGDSSGTQVTEDLCTPAAPSVTLRPPHLPPSLPVSQKPPEKEFNEEAQILAKVAAFIPHADEMEYRSSSNPDDQWQSDDDVGFRSVAMNLEDFLLMETRTLLELEGSGGFPLEAFASDLWRDARSAGHPCTDVHSIRETDRTIDGNCEESTDRITQRMQSQVISEETETEKNQEKDGGYGHAIQEYRHSQQDYFMSILFGKPLGDIVMLVDGLRESAAAAWHEYWLSCGEDPLDVPQLPVEEVSDLLDSARCMDNLEACRPILDLAAAMGAALELHRTRDIDNCEVEDEQRLDGNVDPSVNDVAEHSGLNARETVWEDVEGWDENSEITGVGESAANNSITSITGIDLDLLEDDSDGIENVFGDSGSERSGSGQKLSSTSYAHQSASAEYGSFTLPIIFEKHKTGFEQHRELDLQEGKSIIGGKYRYVKALGGAAFSVALECVDVTDTKRESVCLKMIKNNKEYLDQSLDEIRILSMINKKAEASCRGGVDTMRLLRLHEFFYFREHLFIVTERLGDNLYEFGNRVRDMEAEAPEHIELSCNKYFNLNRLSSVARQLLTALNFVHGLGLIHCDLKPENVLVESMQGGACRVKLIDFGSTCFATDRMEPYIQSRTYRAPEVVLGGELTLLSCV